MKSIKPDKLSRKNQPFQIQSIISRIRNLFAAKLGRCPFCIRASAIGSMVSFAICAIVFLVGAHPSVTVLFLLISGSFSLLSVSHFIAYLYRFSRRLRDRDRRKITAKYARGWRIGRREFVGRVARAAVGVIVFSLTGRTVVLAHEGDCHDLTEGNGLIEGGWPIFGIGVDSKSKRAKDKAVIDAIGQAIDLCNQLCADGSCAGKCNRSGDVNLRPISRADYVELEDGWGVKTALLECPCKCYKCEPGHAPASGENMVMGIGDPNDEGGALAAAEREARAQARTICRRWCERTDDCPEGENCRRGEPTVAQSAKPQRLKGKKIKWSGEITDCKCGCS